MPKDRDSCCSCDDREDDRQHSSHTEHQHSHDESKVRGHEDARRHDDHEGHSHGDSKFNFRRELLLIGVIGGLLAIGIIWQQPLQQSFQWNRRLFNLHSSLSPCWLASAN